MSLNHLLFDFKKLQEMAKDRESPSEFYHIHGDKYTVPEAEAEVVSWVKYQKEPAYHKKD